MVVVGGGDDSEDDVPCDIGNGDEHGVGGYATEIRMDGDAAAIAGYMTVEDEDEDE